MGILCAEAAIVVTFRLTTCGIRQNYHISVRIEMVICEISVILRINQIESSEIYGHITAIDIRYDIRAVPQVDFASDTMSKPIGAIGIVSILNRIIRIAILRTKQAIRITCNKRAV